MQSIALTGQMELLILKRAEITNKHKPLTVRQARREILRVQSNRTDRLLTNELRRIEQCNCQEIFPDV